MSVHHIGIRPRRAHRSGLTATCCPLTLRAATINDTNGGTMRVQRWLLAAAGWVLTMNAAVPLQAQPSARAWLEQAAAAMGGLERLQGLDNLVMTGFGETQSQQGGGNASPDPRAPAKWQVTRDVERVFDFPNERAVNRARGGSLFPFAIERGWDRNSQLQTGVAMLDHPLPALLEALDPGTRLGPVRTEDGLNVVEFTIEQGATLWLAIDPLTKLPAWVRSIGPSTTLGDVTTTTYFTGYLPFED
jgi:hypothetical protein